VEHQEHFL
jgi:hypothetical protein